MPTVNFVVFPVVQTLTSRPLRSALYRSYCYVNETVANSVSGGTPAANEDLGCNSIDLKGFRWGLRISFETT